MGGDGDVGDSTDAVVGVESLVDHGDDGTRNEHGG